MNPNIRNLPDLRHIRTFIAVARSGGFSRAAKELFMTQPGVTTHVSKLEQAVGYKLLERYPRRILLTPSGRRFYEFALNLLEQYADTLETMQQGVTHVHGWLRLASPGGFAGFLLRHLSALQDHHPGLRFSLSYQPNEVILREIGQGRLDVGFITQQPDEEGFLTEQIISEQIVIIRPQDNTLSRVLTLEELMQSRFIDYPDRRYLLASWIDHHYCGAGALDADSLNYACFVNNLEAVIQLVGLGRGCAIVPLSAVATHSLREKFQIVAGPNADPLVQPVYWTMRSDQYLSKRLQILKNSFLPATGEARTRMEGVVETR